jgi:hypothetical protein
MATPLTARAPVAFTPPTLAQKTLAENAERVKRGEEQVDAPVIMVRVPTMYERDSFASMLVRGGVVHYSRSQIRDLMLAGVAFLFDDEKFDEVRGQLEELWQAGDSAKVCQDRRDQLFTELQERQSQLPAGKKMTSEQIEAQLLAITPEVQIPDAARVRITAIQQDITSRYEPLQKAFADLAEQDVKRAWLCVEIYTVNFRGLEHTPDGNGRGGLKREEVEWLRGAIGGEAFDELGDFIFRLHAIDGDEEKNLLSLIENTSAPTGSHLVVETMSDPESEAGSSADTPSGSTPATASRKTTGRSSDSMKPAAKKTGRSKPTPTAAP